MGYQAERHAVPAPLRGTVELHFTYDEEYGAARPTLNVGVIAGGINTNVVPDKVTLRLDRRIIPEEGAAEVEARLAQVMRQAVQASPASRSKSGGCCLPRRCGRARHRHDWPRPCKGTPARCLRKLLALALVRSIRMRASMARPACRSGCTGRGRARCRRQMLSVRMKTSCLRICAAQPLSSLVFC
ncbi:MAG TPA: peptidase dimerization domain-containing protein [Hyphomicrobiaceae bacterium]|jgi:Peptidase dimerisation domain|nr:peptidase dimerization domain-containing protein [Hyphomicrobiaceae bacterium]